MAPEQYPWYDGRRPPYKNPWADDRPADEVICEEERQAPTPETPKAIYEYLDRHILKQDEAKKCAAMVLYNALQGHSEHAFFVGPSGSGKTAIWRALQDHFPDMIELCDGSRLTTEGFKGDHKVVDLLKNEVVLHSNGNVILVVDEADKAFAWKETSSRESVGQQIAAEFLKIMDGITLAVTSNKTDYYIDTTRISLVFCGAFSRAAHEIAEKNTRKQIGFGSLVYDAKPYDREITTEDLIAHGVLPELLGRISRVVNLSPMTTDDYYEMLGAECSPAARLERQYGVSISLSPETRRALAETAASSGLGTRAVESALRQKLDEALFENCEQSSFEF